MEDFFKKVYRPEDKTIDAWYYVSSETNTQTKLLNVQEKELSGKEWANGAVDYRFKVQEVKLPKSQIKVLAHDPNREGYYLIKIPYWLFKKNLGLEIHRISVFKKFSIKPDDPEIDKFSTTDYHKALKGAGTDMNHVKIVVDNRQKSLTPKPTPTPRDKNYSNVIWKLKYSKD